MTTLCIDLTDYNSRQKTRQALLDLDIKGYNHLVIVRQSIPVPGLWTHASRKGWKLGNIDEEIYPWIEATKMSRIVSIRFFHSYTGTDNFIEAADYLQSLKNTRIVVFKNFISAPFRDMLAYRGLVDKRTKSDILNSAIRQRYVYPAVPNMPKFEIPEGFCEDLEVFMDSLGDLKDEVQTTVPDNRDILGEATAEQINAGLICVGFFSSLYMKLCFLHKYFTGEQPAWTQQTDIDQEISWSMMKTGINLSLKYRGSMLGPLQRKRDTVFEEPYNVLGMFNLYRTFIDEPNDNVQYILSKSKLGPWIARNCRVPHWHTLIEQYMLVRYSPTGEERFDLREEFVWSRGNLIEGHKKRFHKDRVGRRSNVPKPKITFEDTQ